MEHDESLAELAGQHGLIHVHPQTPDNEVERNGFRTVHVVANLRGALAIPMNLPEPSGGWATSCGRRRRFCAVQLKTNSQFTVFRLRSFT